MFNRITWLTLYLLLLTPGVLLPQFANIQVSDPASTDPEEVTIAINPANPLNLAAGANINYNYASFDGGWTWSEGQLNTSLGVWGDPCVAFDSSGNCYFAHLSWPPSGNWLDRIVVQKSIDGGVTYDDGVGVGLNPPADQDKEWLVADLTDSPWSDNLYMSWTEFDEVGSTSPLDSTRVLFSRSTNAGTTWSSPIRLSERGGCCLDGDCTVEGAVPAVGPNGEVYVSWAGHELIYFDKSTDGGLTFREDRVIASQPGGWVFEIPGIYRCNGMPVTACDVSDSPHRGNVYVMWSDQRNGTDDTDVFFIKSTDGGDTWADSLRVNSDTGPAQQFFPWMAVDPISGHIYIVFYDRRETVGNATEVWVARSDNGGNTFTDFRVSETPFTPTSSIFFGDYNNIAALDGLVYPIWTRMDNGELSVWTAIIHEAGDIEVAGAAPAELDLLASVPNPWRAGLPFGFELPAGAMVKISVYDATGRLVQNLVDERRAAGQHSITWSPRRLASGVYFIGMTADGYEARKKLVVLQ